MGTKELVQVDESIRLNILTNKGYGLNFDDTRAKKLIEKNLVHIFYLKDYLYYLKDNSEIRSFNNLYDSEDIAFLILFIGKAMKKKWIRSGIWNGFITGYKGEFNEPNKDKKLYYVEFRNTFERIAKSPTWDYKIFCAPKMANGFDDYTISVPAFNESKSKITEPGRKCYGRGDDILYDILKSTGINGQEIFHLMWRGGEVYSIGQIIKCKGFCGGVTEDTASIINRFAELCQKKHRGGFLWDDFVTEYDWCGFYVRRCYSEIYDKSHNFYEMMKYESLFPSNCDSKDITKHWGVKIDFEKAFKIKGAALRTAYMCKDRDMFWDYPYWHSRELKELVKKDKDMQ